VQDQKNSPTAAKPSKLIIWLNFAAAGDVHNATVASMAAGMRSPFVDQIGDPLMSSQQRLYPRQRPDGRLSRTAKIVSAPKAPVINCILIDYSAGGACLQLEKHADLPPRFEVIYGTTRKRCRLVWKRAMRVGVAF
jgi:hypothetical protein